MLPAFLIPRVVSDAESVLLDNLFSWFFLVNWLLCHLRVSWSYQPTFHYAPPRSPFFSTIPSGMDFSHPVTNNQPPQAELWSSSSLWPAFPHRQSPCITEPALCAGIHFFQSDTFLYNGHLGRATWFSWLALPDVKPFPYKQAGAGAPQRSLQSHLPQLGGGR